MDLFESLPLTHEPLASKMRPRTVDEFIGQEHIIGPGRLLRRAIQIDQISSLIFYGPPGTGKTTLAKVIANTTAGRFITLNAVLSGVKEVRQAISDAKEHFSLYQKKSILFVDEVHRWNKAQQDALLPWVENGTVILIGATTENPYFEVNSALVSRSRLFQLKVLTEKDMKEILFQALNDRERGYGRWHVTFDEGAIDHLVKVADGDARTLLNALQLAVETTPETFPPPPGDKIHITMTTCEESIQRKAILYDKEGDYHFDTISAFIKSIRGSDPDAALYWMAKMVKGGEEPRYIFRRMLISASEDVGLADPNALPFVESAARAFDRVGLPEGQFHLAQAALYLAVAPKSNTTLAYFDAVKAIQEEKQRDVPSHLKDASRDSKGFGHGEGYLYPHAYRGHWVAQAYLPDSLKGRIFYQPTDQGYEKSIRQQVSERREEQLAAYGERDDGEVLSFALDSRESVAWQKRSDSAVSGYYGKLRDTALEKGKIRRHDRLFIFGDRGALLTFGALKQAPEGGVWSLISDKSYDEISFLANELPLLERPHLIRESSAKELLKELSQEKLLFDCCIGFWEAKKGGLPETIQLLADGGRLVIVERDLTAGTRLSHIIPSLTDKERLLFKEAEELVFNRKERQGMPVGEAVAEYGVTEREGQRGHVVFSEQRTITEILWNHWFDPNNSQYGGVIANHIGNKALLSIKERGKPLINRDIQWEIIYNFYLFDKEEG